MNKPPVKTAGDQTPDRTRNSVLRQLAMLQTLSVEELREKWLDLFGAQPPDYKRQFMIKRLACRIQELFYGGLSAETLAHLKKVAQADPVATMRRNIPQERTPDGALLPGTRFLRIWNGVRHEVIAREVGFDWNGRIFNSLSAVAREITGTRWNGKIFFGLKKIDIRKTQEGRHD